MSNTFNESQLVSQLNKPFALPLGKLFSVSKSIPNVSGSNPTPIISRLTGSISPSFTKTSKPKPSPNTTSIRSPEAVVVNKGVVLGGRTTENVMVSALSFTLLHTSKSSTAKEITKVCCSLKSAVPQLESQIKFPCMSPNSSRVTSKLKPHCIKSSSSVTPNLLSLDTN